MDILPVVEGKVEPHEEDVAVVSPGLFKGLFEAQQMFIDFEGLFMGLHGFSSIFLIVSIKFHIVLLRMEPGTGREDHVCGAAHLALPGPCSFHVMKLARGGCQGLIATILTAFLRSFVLVLRL